MDSGTVDGMKILHILPELQLGGVERHVIDLSNELACRGEDVLVLSAGGQMESQLDGCVQRRHLPVHRKNPLVGYYCARKIAQWIREEGWQIIHAHSRVPAWIARWASKMAHVPYVVTAHVDFGNKSPWIYAPYREANRVICVSSAVKEAMKNCFYENTTVVINGLDQPAEFWDSSNKGRHKLLFVGRLSSVKGLQDVLKFLPLDLEWTLDVLGDGPQKEEWRSICKERGIANKVIFHGYSDQVDHFMAHSSCLLFPSYTEGMPLTLARAIQIGIPVMASNIAPVAEMKGNSSGLLPVGDLRIWEKELRDFLTFDKTPEAFPLTAVPTLASMIDQIFAVYERSLEDFSRGK